MKDLQRLTINEPSRVAEARRYAVSVASAQGFDEIRLGEVAIIITELATNLLKHGGGGEILLCRIEFPDSLGLVVPGLDILALDQGPGIRNIGQSLRDGYSNAGSLGLGLGAVQRLSALHEIYSAAGKGSAVLSRIWKDPSRLLLPTRLLALGAVCLPLASEEVCGDAWAVEQNDARALLMVADGLGHGLAAADAAREAVRVFRAHKALSPQELIALIHTALKSTRGAAVAVAEVMREQGVVRFAGVGNIAAHIYSGNSMHHLMSHNGTAGVQVRKIQQFEYSWSPGALLVLHSDGLATRWNLEHYPGLQAKHPALIAGMLYRDYARESDDVTVLVAR